MLSAQGIDPGSNAAPSGDELSPTKITATLATEKKRIDAYPADPASYIDLAYTLMDAGLGDLSREQARKAVEVAPQSSLAYSAQAWVLHHNAIGVDYGRGYDADGSMSSYRKAIELAPDDLDVLRSFADSLEYDRDGTRYAPGAHLPEAVRALSYIKAHQKVVEPPVEDNLLIDLFYSGRFKEVLTEIVGPATPLRDGVGLAAVAASQGSAAAISLANQIAGDPKRRSAALNFAAEGLWNLQLYPQAADLLAAGLQEQADSGNTLRKIQLFRTLKPFHDDFLPSKDPGSPVQKLVFSALSSNLTDAVAAANVSQIGFADDTQRQAFLKQFREAAAALHTLSVKTGLPRIVMQDIVFGSMNIVIEPNSEPGFRIVVQVMASPPQPLFVLAEDGEFKVLAAGNDSVAAGNAALYLLHHNREPEARSLLNWKRDQVQRGGGDDPLGGNLFARFWKNGDKGTDAVEAAAAALLAGHADVSSLIPHLVSLRNSASSSRPQADKLAAETDYDLLLTTIYLQAEDGPNAKLTSEQLLRQYPQSPTAIRLVGSADGLTQDWTGWTTLLDSRLATQPGDVNLLRQKAEEAEAEGKYPLAQKSLRTLLDSGKASSADFNTYAWLSLFSNQVDAQATEAAEQANRLTAGSGFAALHTLACIYAVQGRTTEARQLLLQAMSAANLAEPDSATWFGFGLIYEQYGIPDAAIAAYRHVEKPQGRLSPVDTYKLAQLHLTALQKR